MYHHTITIFNYHEGKWYPSVIDSVDLIAADGKNPTAMSGQANSSGVDIIVRCSATKAVETTAGTKSYVSPKAYAKCTDPANCVTFTPEQDFIYGGAWPSTAPAAEDDYPEGLYSALNEEHDGVYMISNVTYFGLLPHFEIGGR